MNLWLVIPYHTLVCVNICFFPSCQITWLHLCRHFDCDCNTGYNGWIIRVTNNIYWFFRLRGSFLVVVLIEFVLNVFTFSWRDLMSSNMCNCTVSFAKIFTLATGATSGVGGVTISWSVWLGGILSSDRDTRCCKFCTSWRNLPSM